MITSINQNVFTKASDTQEYPLGYEVVIQDSLSDAISTRIFGSPGKTMAKKYVYMMAEDTPTGNVAIGTPLVIGKNWEFTYTDLNEEAKNAQIVISETAIMRGQYGFAVKGGIVKALVETGAYAAPEYLKHTLDAAYNLVPDTTADSQGFPTSDTVGTGVETGVPNTTQMMNINLYDKGSRHQP